ncbi:glycosyltransferase [Dactylosporangium sp. AC04546]|uniref:glycosyltransferase n=1 Tax=Dactylosporangium sp. AC04546 TaxID=2862460 RepID=UPI001EE031F6|nr:glycosyltransferase [Dactylosporangium sp. AC04546]WVK79485.1 glycosyltransferase [Dactylosporangium sp. AC04546]
MSVPRVSVIMPNYNHADSLDRTIAAVRAQTVPALEILFVDDCSTDGSVAIATAAGVRVVSTPVNSGPAAARNLGAQLASGDVLLFLDSDVELAPTVIERATALLDARPEAGAVCGMLDDVPLKRDSLLQECRCLQAHYWRISSEGVVSFLFSAICAMRAEVFAEMGPFDARLRETEEVEYGQRLSTRYQVLLTSALSGRHRDEPRLWPLLRKLFRRSRLRIPLYTRRRRFAKGFETSARIFGSVAATAAVLSLPMLLASPLFALVPAALLAVSIGCDAEMYRFVFRRRGTGFGLFFTGVQVLQSVAIVAGAGFGALQWLASREFRGLYDLAPQPRPIRLSPA